jgi:transaldolase
MNPLCALWREHGQAVWLDYIERELVAGGGLARLVRHDGVRGVTSNPAIFRQAIGSSGAYDDQIATVLAERPAVTTVELYEELAIADIRMAADLLRATYDESAGGDGFVSLEVSPRLAHDTAGTVAEARRLWRAVARPNLMIKVPATAEGVPALEELIAAGINVNATLMFSLDHYQAVAHGYLRGLARCAEPSRVASVASFFVSRVDTSVDAVLEGLGTEQALALRGRAAVTNAALAYRQFREIFHGSEFAALAARGAHVQRPLWASTSTKNPAYRDVKYVEELIGPETVNTLPMATLEAFRDHGRPVPGLDQALLIADQTLAALAVVGIDLDRVTEELQVAGVAAFSQAFDGLLERLAQVRSIRASS